MGDKATKKDLMMEKTEWGGKMFPHPLPMNMKSSKEEDLEAF
jgi:hypothetical protein